MIIRKSCAMVLAALLFAISVNAQKNEPVTGTAKTIYGEIGGPGALSVNYDQRFKGEKGLGFRVGIGGINVLVAGLFTLPVGINYLQGSNGHYLELGTGLSAIAVYDGGNFFDTRNSTVIGYFTAGYRYQPQKKGFTGRIFLSPLITPGGFFPIYGGVSAGIRL